MEDLTGISGTARLQGVGIKKVTNLKYLGSSVKATESGEKQDGTGWEKCQLCSVINITATGIENG